MEQHLRMVAALHVILGGLGILGGILVLGVLLGVAQLVQFAATGHDAWLAVPILGAVGAVVFTTTTVLSLPSLIAGWGLFQRRPWGRILGIIASALHLVNLPLGTVVGVYSLWVLLSRESDALFDAGPRRSAL